MTLLTLRGELDDWPHGLGLLLIPWRHRGAGFVLTWVGHRTLWRLRFRPKLWPFVLWRWHWLGWS